MGFTLSDNAPVVPHSQLRLNDTEEQMRLKQNQWMTLGLAMAASMAAACGSKGGSSGNTPAAQPNQPPAAPEATATGTGTATDSTSTATETDEDDDELVDEGDASALLNVFPAQLALTFFSDGGGASLRLQDGEAATESDEQAAIEDASRPPAEKAEDTKERLMGQADDCVADVLKRPPVSGRGETCYEFDQDQIYGGRGSSDYMGNQNGLNDGGEACMVAFAKAKVAVVNDLLERAKAMVETMLCQAKKADPTIAPPAADGESLDLKAALAEAAFADDIEIAKLERVDVDGAPVYKSTIVMTAGSQKRTVVLVHSPDEGEGYHGSLYTIQHAPSEAALALLELPGPGPAPGPQGPGPGGNLDRVLSITYARVEDPDAPGTYLMQGDLVRANIHPDLTDIALGTAGVLDLSAIRNFDVGEGDQNYGAPMLDGAVVSNSNDVLSGQTKITFRLDDDGVGVTSYFENPGGNYNEAARGMIAQVDKAEDGTLKGCSVSGAALGKENLMMAFSIAKAQKLGQTLEPVGYYHPFFELSGKGAECTKTEGATDSLGTYHATSCTQNGQTEQSKWYFPKIADAALAEEFVSEQVGGIVTRQCYVLDASTGVWGIDTDEIAEEAGFELVRNTDTTKFIAPPQLDDKVRPFEGDIGKTVE
jgi:hypothetical protein